MITQSTYWIGLAFLSLWVGLVYVLPTGWNLIPAFAVGITYGLVFGSRVDRS